VEKISRGLGFSAELLSSERFTSSRQAFQAPVIVSSNSGEGFAPQKADIQFLDLPNISIAQGTDTSFVAASSKKWSSSLSVYASQSNEGFMQRGTIARNATIGRLETSLPASQNSGRWQLSSDITLELIRGELSGLPDAQVLAGANALAVATEDGLEIVQFAHAEIIGNERYRLSRLLRGQSGTEPQMRLGASAGAAAVLLDTSLHPLSLTAGERGLPLNWRVVPGNSYLTDPSVETTAFEGGLRALQPLAPVHLKRTATGFVWVRRDRFGADSWEQIEIPMSESGEEYEVVLASATDDQELFRTTVTDPRIDLPVQPQWPSIVKVSVAQISAISGPGQASVKTFQL
jgi:hypothetical protein